MAAPSLLTREASLAAFAERVRGIAGGAHVRPADPADAIAGVAPGLVVEPATEAGVAEALRLADGVGLRVAPRGGGTKMGWGNPPSGVDIVLSLARLDRIIEHAWADLTVTVEAGCPVGTLQRALAQHGQQLAVDALWPERATVGGILATNDSGALRLRYGGLRDLIIGVTLALADGTLARSGGKVVKNVAGYDLPKLAVGALGTLGVITQATFRLHPMPQGTRTVTIRAGDASAAQALMLAIQDLQLGVSALQTRIASDTPAELDVLLEGSPASLAAQADTLRAAVGPDTASADAADVWGARAALWETGADAGAVAKLSILPTDLGATAAMIHDTAGARTLAWRAVVQGTGLGLVRLDGDPSAVRGVLQELRGALEARGGSLVVLRQPGDGGPIEAWGDPGDALPLMRALKREFDPRGTLNPGRFVGGI